MEASPTVGGRGDWDFVRPPDFRSLQSKDGIYVLPHVRAGKVYAFVNVSWVHAESPLVDVGPKTPSPQVTVTLPATGTLIVRVVDKVGNPVSGAHVFVQHPTDRQFPSGKTDKVGEYRVVVPAHVWMVGAGDPKDVLQILGDLRAVRIRPFKTTTVEFTRP